MFESKLSITPFLQSNNSKSHLIFKELDITLYLKALISNFVRKYSFLLDLVPKTRSFFHEI